MLEVRCKNNHSLPYSPLRVRGKKHTMKKYQYDMTIVAATETEADGKMTALTTLVAKLSLKELSKLAHIVSNDPVKTLAAKKYLGV